MKLQFFQKHSLPNRRLLASALAFMATGALLTIPAEALESSGRTTFTARQDSDLLVGIGDSYTSGVGVTPYEPASVITGCDRSLSGAYPLLAADELGVDGRNFACSGATTAAFSGSFKAEPAQTAQLADADAVVMTIGGNDVGALSALATGDLSGIPAALQALPGKLRSAYAAVESAAPEAKVYVVTYPDILPATSASLEGCVPDQLQDLDLTQLRVGVTALNTAITLTAKQSGLEVIDASDAVKGHELCSDDPWVVGIGAPGALHPNSEGQQAIADLVVATLKGSFGTSTSTSTTADECGCTSTSTSTSTSTTSKKSTTTKRPTTTTETTEQPEGTSSTFITPATIPVTSRKPTTSTSSTSTSTSTTEPEIVPEEDPSTTSTSTSTTEPEVAAEEPTTTTTEQPAEVQGVARERGAELAETGAEVTRVAAIGLVLLGVGVGLIWTRKVLRERSDHIR
jgi:lysophospholipase L1-like esterase